MATTSQQISKKQVVNYLQACGLVRHVASAADPTIHVYVPEAYVTNTLTEVPFIIKVRTLPLGSFVSGAHIEIGGKSTHSYQIRPEVLLMTPPAVLNHLMIVGKTLMQSHSQADALVRQVVGGSLKS